MMPWTTSGTSASRALAALGCEKGNLQVRGSNEAVTRFYAKLGYAIEDRVSLGRRLQALP